jgi:hypothetical protein
MTHEPALWRKVFDAVEGHAGRRLQSGVNRDDFLDAVTVARRLEGAIGRRAEDVSTTVLHLLNIPARRDVRRAMAQLTRIERELRVLSHELHEQRSSLHAGAE